jgi:hypothetical protein
MELKQAHGPGSKAGKLSGKKRICACLLFIKRVIHHDMQPVQSRLMASFSSQLSGMSRSSVLQPSLSPYRICMAISFVSDLEVSMKFEATNLTPFQAF